MNGGAVRGGIRHQGQQLGAQKADERQAKASVNDRVKTRKTLDTDRATPRYPFRSSGRR